MMDPGSHREHRTTWLGEVGIWAIGIAAERVVTVARAGIAFTAGI